MEKPTCRIAVEVYSSGGVKVDFLEGHVRKRELMRIIKLLKIEHRLLVRKYREKVILENKKKELEKTKNIIYLKEMKND